MCVTFDAAARIRCVGAAAAESPPRATVEVVRPGHGLFPPLDPRSLRRLFSALSIQDVLAVVVRLAAARRVLVVSSSAANLADACEALRALLWPLRWAAPYAPVLPADAGDLIAAPVPYLIGVVASEGNIDRIAAMAHPPVVVDLDGGAVTTPIEEDVEARAALAVASDTDPDAARCIRDVAVAASCTPLDTHAVRVAFSAYWARVFVGGGDESALARHLEAQCGAWAQLQPGAAASGSQRAAQLECFACLRRAVASDARSTPDRILSTRAARGRRGCAARGGDGGGDGRDGSASACRRAGSGGSSSSSGSSDGPRSPPRSPLRARVFGSYRAGLPTAVRWGALWRPMVRRARWASASEDAWTAVLRRVRSFLPLRPSSALLATLELDAGDRRH